MRLGTTRFRHDHPYLYLLATFSPDGKILATGGNNEIRLWDPATGKLLREIRDDFGYSEPIFAPDGKLLVTAPADGTVSLWDTTTGRRSAQLRGGHEKQVSHAAFSADGTRLVTLCTARRLCHWNVATGTLAKTIEMPVPRRVHSMCFAPDARTLAVSPRDDAPVFLLETDTGKETVKFEGEFARGGFGLAFSRDGKTVATSLVDLGKWDDLTTVALWDAGTGKLRRHFTMPARAVRRLVFAPDGRTLVTAGGEPTVHLLDAATGKQRHDWPGHEAVVSALAFAPDGSTLVSGGLDGALRVWDLKAGRHLRELPGHRWGVSGLAVAPNGAGDANAARVVSAGNDGCVRVQSLTGKLIRRIALGQAPEQLKAPEAMVYALGCAPDGKTAATFSLVRNPAQPMYHVWDLATGKPLVSRRDSANVISVRQFSPDARLVMQQVDGGGGGEGAAGGFKDDGAGGPAPISTVLVHDVATGKQVAALPLPRPGGHLGAFARDRRTLLTATFRGERKADGWTYHNALHLWELATGKERLTISFSAPGRVCQIALAPSGRAAATVSDDGVIHVWDLASGKQMLRHAGPALGAPALAYAPDSRSVAVGYADSTILVWDAVGAERKPGLTRTALGDQKMDASWAALAGADARHAHEAMWTLLAAPEGDIPGTEGRRVGTECTRRGRARW
jgi:WD40 repeat protein